ncbi:MAG TPA: glucose-6-phosphate isomerase [Gemmatimonadaceae bacterium]|nr:glucose-6-phosphate isomerase [Gemmatimonadaceae bacterium]
MAIRIDYSNMIAEQVPDGVPERELHDAETRFRDTHAALLRHHAAGVLGFLDLPGDVALHEQVTRYVAATRGRFREVVILGIGGSALGPIALRTSLRPPLWNVLDAAHRDEWPRLHVLDNVDPGTIATLLAGLPLRETLFLVVSKSGGTAETMAQYLVVRARLDGALGAKAREHLAFVTDPARGALRAIADAEGIETFDIPPNVGGRFSVLSPVGTLPAALIGIDTAALLAGAGDMARRCDTDALIRNPAGVFATLQWLADARHGLRVHVFMPYSDALRDFAGWFVQLWAESLGKARSDGTHVGPTPVAALGATDQHSQVQLFMEGPVDKTVTFVSVGEPSAEVEIPRLHGDVAELSYLGGHALGELLEIERQATAGALAQRGRPNMTIHLGRVDPWHVGGLIMLLEIATVYAGSLYGVDPMNQPGVELGKQFTYAMLGREDAEAARREWNLLPKSEPRWSV